MALHMVAHDPYASGVLSQNVHARLVADLTNIAADASIRPEFVWTPLAKVCGPEEVSWVKRFKFHELSGKSGLCLVGTNPSPDAETRMSAIAGALVRNWVRARVVTMKALADADEGDDVLRLSCVCVPNFFVTKSKAGSSVGWKVENLLDTLVVRQVRGLQTVLYVEDLNKMALEYGAAVKAHIENHYNIVQV